MANPEEDFVEPIVIRDEPRIGLFRGMPSRSRSSESTAAWGTLALVAVTGGAYAIYRAGQPAPPAPAPEAAQVVAVPEPEPLPPPRRPRPVRRPAAPEAEAAAPVRVITEKSEPEKKFVDPIEGFETGEAFDNPPSPGRYGQRTSGLMERGTPNARPNAPDPVFRNPR